MYKILQLSWIGKTTIITKRYLQAYALNSILASLSGKNPIFIDYTLVSQLFFLDMQMLSCDYLQKFVEMGCIKLFNPFLETYCMQKRGDRR